MTWRLVARGAVAMWWLRVVQINSLLARCENKKKLSTYYSLTARSEGAEHAAEGVKSAVCKFS
jgi:hypothetical protein